MGMTHSLTERRFRRNGLCVRCGATRHLALAGADGTLTGCLDLSLGPSAFGQRGQPLSGGRGAAYGTSATGDLSRDSGERRCKDDVERVPLATTLGRHRRQAAVARLDVADIRWKGTAVAASPQSAQARRAG